MARRHVDDVIVRRARGVLCGTIATATSAVVAAAAPVPSRGVGGGEDAPSWRAQCASRDELPRRRPARRRQARPGRRARDRLGVFPAPTSLARRGRVGGGPLLIDRIAANRRAYEARNAKKNASEATDVASEVRRGPSRLAEESLVALQQWASLLVTVRGLRRRGAAGPAGHRPSGSA